MSHWIFLAFMLLLTLVVVVAPLWRRQSDQPLGSGVETDELADLWAAEKDRLTGEQRTLDLALAVGEIDEKTHNIERSLLYDEAARALKLLRKARRSSVSHKQQNSPSARPQIYSRAGQIITVGIVAVTLGANYYLAHQDLQRFIVPDGNEHALVASNIKTPSTASGDIRPDDQAPDIGAMVAQLELRVKEAGDKVNTPDLLMLARSYRVVGKNNDAIDLYRRVLKLDPANTSAILALGSMLLNSKEDSEKTEAGQFIESVLAAKPGLPEALWLKSLWLLQNHKMNEARSLLKKLSPLVSDNPSANKAVQNLLAKLNTMGATPALQPK